MVKINNNNILNDVDTHQSRLFRCLIVNKSIIKYSNYMMNFVCSII